MSTEASETTAPVADDQATVAHRTRDALLKQAINMFQNRIELIEALKKRDAEYTAAIELYRMLVVTLEQLRRVAGLNESADRFVWIAAFGVDRVWVEDGFDLTDERAKNMLAEHVAWAYNHELDAKVIAAPDADAVARCQGYKSAADRAERDNARKGR